MLEREGHTLDQLTPELQRQLNFEMDPSGEWLINDEFRDVGGLNYGESIPARSRVSKDGTSFEIGARRQDLEGLLELNKLASDSVQDVETIEGFWKEHPRFSSRTEEEWVYIGVNIEPTTEGLERSCTDVSLAYDVAFQSAVSGRSYEELSEDKRWYGHIIKYIQEEKPNQKTVLFGKNDVKEDETVDRDMGSTCEVRAPISAENMREFPLDTSMTSLSGIPGKMTTWDGRERNIKNAWIIAHNGQENVDIIDSDAHFDW